MKDIQENSLHQLVTSELSHKRVFQRSYWNDDKWLLDGRAIGCPPSQNEIRWAVELPDGSKLTDQKHEHLLEVAKQFIWSLKVDPPAGSSFASDSTLFGLSYCLFALIKWMVSNNYRTFSELKPVDCKYYCTYISEIREEANGKKLTVNRLQLYIKVLVDLYRQRNKLKDAIQEEPFQGRTAYKIATNLASQEKGWIPPIPDQIAIASLKEALEWLEWRANDIIQLLQLINDSCYINKHGRRRYYHTNKILAGFNFSIPPDSCEPWHAKLRNVREVRILFDSLIDACITIVFGFVGTRVHELLGLEANCVEIQSSADGLLEIFYLVGHTSKPVKQSVRWVAGARVVGSDDLPPPIKAIYVTEELLSAWREPNTNSKAFLCFGQGQPGFPVTNQELGSKLSCSLVGMTKQWINRRLNRFNHKYVPLSREWYFTSHQWRKTFARFVAMTDRSSLAALSQHFLHLSIAMTDRGYIGNDFELEELIDELVRAETADILIQVLLQGKPVAGRMAEELMEKHSALKTHFQGMTIEDAEEEIRWIISDSGMYVHACDWGWCMYRPESSRCEGSEKGPNPANRGPSVCSGCSNLLVEEKHRPYWQDRHDRNARLIDQLDETGAPELQKVAPQSRVRECQRILGNLNALMVKDDGTT